MLLKLGGGVARAPHSSSRRVVNPAIPTSEPLLGTEKMLTSLYVRLTPHLITKGAIQSTFNFRIFPRGER